MISVSRIQRLLGSIPGSYIAGSCDVSIFNFRETSPRIAMVTTSVYSPVNKESLLSSPDIPAVFAAVCFPRHSDWSEMTPSSFSQHEFSEAEAPRTGKDFSSCPSAKIATFSVNTLPFVGFFFFTSRCEFYFFSYSSILC